MLVDVEEGLELFKRKPTGDVHRRCMELYTKRMHGMSEEEFEYQLAVVGVDTLDELSYKVPPRRPQVLVDFDNTKKGWEWKKETQESKTNMEKKVRDLPEVQKYNGLLNIVYRNQANLIHLEQDLVLLQKRGDKENFKKVWAVYAQYPNVLYGFDLEQPIFIKRAWK